MARKTNSTHTWTQLNYFYKEWLYKQGWPKEFKYVKKSLKPHYTHLREIDSEGKVVDVEPEVEESDDDVEVEESDAGVRISLSTLDLADIPTCLPKRGPGMGPLRRKDAEGVEQFTGNEAKVIEVDEPLKLTHKTVALESTEFLRALEDNEFDHMIIKDDDGETEYEFRMKDWTITDSNDEATTIPLELHKMDKKEQRTEIFISGQLIPLVDQLADQDNDDEDNDDCKIVGYTQELQDQQKLRQKTKYYLSKIQIQASSLICKYFI